MSAEIGPFRVVVRELGGEGRAARTVTTPIGTGATLTVGQRADLPIGVEPRDAGVSGLALTVQAQVDGWAVTFANRNGHVLQRWAAAPEWVRSPVTRVLSGTRIGIRVVGVDNLAQHWVLLERDRDESELADGPEPTGTTVTDDTGSAYETKTLARPNALTPVQLATVHAVFGDFLAWPPQADPVARSLDSARRRLGAGSESAVKDRLTAVRARAQALGFDRRVGLTDPAYLFHLVEHGYLADPGPAGGGISA